MRNLLITLLLVASVFAQDYNSGSSGNIKGALENLTQTAKQTMLFSVIIELVIGVVLLAGAILVYFKKLRNPEKKETAWLIGALALGLIGFLFLIGGIIGLFIYFTAPVIVNELAYG